MAKDNLNHFAAVLLEEASAQRDALVAKLEQEREIALSEADRRLAQRLKQGVSDGKAFLEQQKQQYLTKRETELHQTLLQNRQRILTDIFSEVETQVRAFTKSEGYRAFLEAEYKEALPYFQTASGETLCYVMEADLPLAKELFTLPGIQIVASEQDFIGGFLLQNHSLRRFADCSLLTRMEEQKESFTQNGTLVIETSDETYNARSEA